jgi:hypothetical protein
MPAAITALGGGFLLVSMGTIDAQLLDNTTATTSLRETNHCGVLGGSSKWLGFRPLAGGMMQVDTIGSAINTVLAVYTGTNLLTIREVACDDNGAPDRIRSLVRFNARANTDYLVAVDGVNGAKGSINLNWRLGLPPTIPPGSGSPVVVYLGGALSLSVSAYSPTPDLTYGWRYQGTNMPGQTNATLTLNNFQAAQAGAYSVVVRNFAGSATNVFSVAVALPITLQATRQQTGTGEVVRIFSQQAASKYILQRSLHLTPESWTNVLINDSATPGAIDFREPILQQSNRFYRIVPR